VSAGHPAPTVERFISRVARSVAEGSFVRLVLSSPTPAAGRIQRVLGRLVMLRDHDQPVVSLTLKEQDRDTTRNLPPAEAADWIRSQLSGGFRSAVLQTTSRDWQLALEQGRAARLIAHRPQTRVQPHRGHNRARQHVIDDSARDWLEALGLVDHEGRVFPSRADKHRQVLRYAEILDHLVHEVALPIDAPLHVADVGCGRGYLTFAAWHLLRRRRGWAAHVLGLEARPELASEANATVHRLKLDGLRFVSGTIADAALPALDILIALHACNTATDDAIRRGIDHGARLIVVAPCCHQQLRPQLRPPDLWKPILRHGLMLERFAEWFTDGLRTLYLEWAGYRTRVIEFVPSEHTPKNLLIAGVRSGAPFSNSELRERIVALESAFGPIEHPLRPLLEAGQGLSAA
jgi:SAM-dependent methyltransferase